MTPIQLHVIGIAAPQGSKVRVANGAMLDGTSPAGRARLAEWRRAVADQARAHLDTNPHPPLAEPLHITIEFAFPPTKTDPYRHWHVVAPDLDKIIRSTFDALTHSGLVADDRYFCQLTARKSYALCVPPGATITIESLAESEANIREVRKAQAALQRKHERTTA